MSDLSSSSSPVHQNSVVQQNQEKQEILEILKVIYKELIIQWESINISDIEYCDRCLGQDCETHNLAVFCDLCSSMIHQKCYGGEILNLSENQIGQLDFFCSRCQNLFDTYQQTSIPISKDQIKCHFCPNLRGIIKQIQLKNQTIYSHICCAELLFSKGFQNNEKKVISHENNLFQNLIKENELCLICKNNYGTVRKCQIEDCKFYYHITCGREGGVITDEYYNVQYPLYCYDHLMRKQDMYEQKTPDFARFRQKVDNQRAFQKDWQEFLIHRNNTQYSLNNTQKNQQQQQQQSNKKRKHREIKEEKGQEDEEDFYKKNRKLTCRTSDRILKLDHRIYTTHPSESLQKQPQYRFINGIEKFITTGKDGNRLKIMSEQQLQEEVSYWFVHNLHVDFDLKQVRITKYRNQDLYNLCKNQGFPTEINNKEFYAYFMETFVEKVVTNEKEFDPTTETSKYLQNI